MSHHLPGTRDGQLQRCQLFRLRPEVVKVSPGTGNICVFQVFEAQKGRTEERGCDCEHKDDRSVGCVQLRSTVRKKRRMVYFFFFFSFFVKQRYTNTCVNCFSTRTLRKMALARMLVIVSTIFIVTASPIVALNIARSTVYDLFIDRSYNNIVFVLFCYLRPSTYSSECSTPAVSTLSSTS